MLTWVNSLLRKGEDAASTSEALGILKKGLSPQHNHKARVAYKSTQSWIYVTRPETMTLPACIRDLWSRHSGAMVQFESFLDMAHKVSPDTMYEQRRSKEYVAN